MKIIQFTPLPWWGKVGVIALSVAGTILLNYLEKEIIDAKGCEAEESDEDYA